MVQKMNDLDLMLYYSGSAGRLLRVKVRLKLVFSKSFRLQAATVRQELNVYPGSAHARQMLENSKTEEVDEAQGKGSVATENPELQRAKIQWNRGSLAAAAILVFMLFPWAILQMNSSQTDSDHWWKNGDDAVSEIVATDESANLDPAAFQAKGRGLGVSLMLKNSELRRVEGSKLSLEHGDTLQMKSVRQDSMFLSVWVQESGQKMKRLFPGGGEDSMLLVGGSKFPPSLVWEKGNPVQLICVSSLSNRNLDTLEQLITDRLVREDREQWLEDDTFMQVYEVRGQ